MRHLRLLIPLLGLLAVLATVQVCESLHLRDREQREATDRRAQSFLDAREPQVIYQDVPQRAALEDYARRNGLPLKVNWEILKAEGIDPVAPLSVRLYNVRVSKGLQVLLDAISIRYHQLDYVIAEDGSIEVVTDRIAAERAVIEVYDVSDLFTLIPELPKNVGKQSEFSKTRDELIEDVTRLVTDTVDTHSWESNGGDVGRINYFHGRLIITQTPAGHRLTGNLLENLRETRVHPELRRLDIRLWDGDGGGR